MDNTQDKQSSPHENLPANERSDSNQPTVNTGEGDTLAVNESKEGVGQDIPSANQISGSQKPSNSPQESLLMPNKSSIAGVPGDLGAKPMFGYDIPKTPPKPKRSIPKIIIVIPVAVAILSLVAVSILSFVKSRKNTGIVGKKGEIHWWSNEELALYQPLIDEYQEANPGVKIIYEKQSNIDYRVRLTNALAKGEGPDIFHIHNSWVPMFSQHLSVLPETVMSKGEFSRSFFPVIVDDLSIQKGIVGMPLEYDAITLYINESLFSLAVRLPPETWSEFTDIAVELTQKDADKQIIQSGATMGLTENVDHWPEIAALMMFQNGANPASPGVSGAASEALSYYKLFAGGATQTWSSLLPSSTEAFANGKVAMYFAPVYRASEIRKMNPNLRFKTVPIPQLPKDDPNAPNISYATYWFDGVWSRSVNSTEAWKFLKFMSSSESLIKLHDNAVKLGYVGKPYPRSDITELLINDPYAGSILFLAQNAKSWYLAGNTNDGENGINSRLAKIYEGILSKAISSDALKNASPQIDSVLTEFGAK